jgi:hypothetical protein
MENRYRGSGCSNIYFEAVHKTPVNSNFRLIFVRCTAFIIVVGVIDYYNTGTLIEKIAAKHIPDLDNKIL